MLKSIIKKEWIKLKIYFIGLVFITLVSLVYFAFNLNFSFTTIEPESMMWYRFAHLEDKPYHILSYLFLSIGFVISLAQYIPERINKRIKIMAHLPLNLSDALFMHLFIGICFIVVLAAFLSICLLYILTNYYPQEIVLIALKDCLFYTLISIILYIGLSSVILESKNIIAFLKLTLVVIFVLIFLKIHYKTEDILCLLFLFFIPFLTLDSFYSIKEQRLTSNIFKSSLIIVIIALVFFSYTNYTQNYKHTFNKYYIFYSNILNDFIYQKNFGKHQFEYGVKDKQSFNQYKYESYLPFVYWRNLDIQKKLPIEIKGINYDKETIKASRLGFSYKPNMLQKPEVGLYPLFNPDPTIGMIKFPEEVFTINKNGVKIYNFDDKLLQKQTDELNIKLNNLGFEYPALNIWGKTSNIKPYDKGYLVYDNNKQLYNLKKQNNIIKVKQIQIPKDVELAHINISENKQKILSGYAIDTNSNFYLLTWDFKFKKVELKNFDYKKMKLKLISNPINYLIRYDDSNRYFAVVFDKKLNKIKEILLQ